MVGASETVALAQSTPAAAEDKSVLGKDDFLRLLLAQLRNQDPLSPMEGTEFAAQLAQFSSLEQLANINTSLSNSLDSNYLLTQAISNTMSASIIGKDVRASGEGFHYSGEGEVQLGFTLASAADTVKVTLYDSARRAVRSIQLGSADKGDTTFSWDGQDGNGAALAAGEYTFAVEALDGDGNALTAHQYLFGTVSAVRFRPEGTMFVVDGVEIPLSDILEILHG
jgi:flagellar basal-body rod modification protein FlgD